MLIYQLNVPWHQIILCVYILSHQAPLCGTSCQFGFRKQTPSLPLRLGLKLSFLIKLIVRDGSDDPETSHSSAAINLDYWRTSCDAPLLTPLSLLSMYLCTYIYIVVINLCFSFSVGIPGLVSTLSCPLNPQVVEADGHHFWFWWKFFPVERKFFLSTITLPVKMCLSKLTNVQLCWSKDAS